MFRDNGRLIDLLRRGLCELERAQEAIAEVPLFDEEHERLEKYLRRVRNKLEKELNEQERPLAI